jgi:hypothetical protein
MKLRTQAQGDLNKTPSVGDQVEIQFCRLKTFKRLLPLHFPNANNQKAMHEKEKQLLKKANQGWMVQKQE